jgi:hypothetical protein
MRNSFALFVRSILILTSIVIGAEIACAQSITAVDVTCTHVDPVSGYITIEWTAPSDPLNEFTSYKIYMSANGGAFFAVLDAPVNIGTLTYTNTVASGFINQMCFYVQCAGQTAAGANFLSPSSDTLCSINLDLSYAEGQGVADLEWTNPFLFENNPPANATYEVMAEYPAGTWTTIANLPLDSTSMTYPVPYCSATLGFQVSLNTGSPCNIVSDYESAPFVDDVNPEVPEVTSVSVNDNSSITITWNENPSLDTQGYIIYVVVNNVTTPIATVYGRSNTEYTIPNPPANPLQGSLNFLVAAFDNCVVAGASNFNTSATQDTPSSSIYLPPIPYAVCSDHVTFSWTPYIGWEDGVDIYIIYRSVDGSSYAPYDTVAGNVTTYADNNLQLYSNQGYYIEAVSVGDGYRSRSGKSAFPVVYPDAPTYLYVQSATVISKEEVSITLVKAPTAFPLTYLLQRERRNSPGVFEEIAELESDTETSLEFVDRNVNTDAFNYKYRVVVRNTCNDYVDTTNVGQTILLNGIADNELFQNLLQWNSYLEWPQGIERFELHRKQGENGSDEILITSPSTIFYKDNVSDLWEEPGKFCYWVEVYGNSFPETPVELKSVSNEVCLTIEPKIWVPNAFILDSRIEERRTFGPVLSFADPKNFRMIIYSRWGDVVYDSTDPESRWDGNSDRGKVVEQGVYSYFVNVQDGNGKAYESRGTVLLMVGPE